MAATQKVTNVFSFNKSFCVLCSTLQVCLLYCIILTWYEYAFLSDVTEYTVSLIVWLHMPLFFSSVCWGGGVHSFLSGMFDLIYICLTFVTCVYALYF